MPAPIPPGHTRGPIVFLGSTSEGYTKDLLLQRFLNEAGGYGARIVVVGIGQSPAPALYQQGLASLEAERVQLLTIERRADALGSALTALLEQATGILLVAESALQLAGLIGGTPLAQTIRRANAQGKTVGGIGRSAAILCQHMIAFETRAQQPRPFVHRQLIQFAPGLGIVNRVVLDIEHDAAVDVHQGLARLLAAVAYNPFLVGVSIEADTGVVIYPDTTLEAFGANNVLVLDGNGVTHTNVHERDATKPAALLGTTLHLLSHGYTFNFDQRQAYPPPPSDIPTEGAPNHEPF
jgi:cyanophycinase